MAGISAGRARASLAVAVVTGLVGAALAVPASATPLSAPAGAKLAAGLEVGSHDVGALTKQAASGAKPRGVSLPEGVPSSGKYGFLLKLDTSSTKAAFVARRAAGSKTAAVSAARSQLGRVTTAQNSVVAELPKGTDVLYRTHAVLAGVGVYTNVRNYAALTQLAGVAAVYPIAPKTRSNSYAVPLQGAPTAWSAHSNEGQNSTIAVIDTGLDYTHADFGGPGTVAAYDAANEADTVAPAPTSYDADKYAGGFDLAGDAYNPGAAVKPVDTPTPDPNPLDCTEDVGHGTHVAGSAAGYGVNADGSTYTGAYNADTPFDAMKIGPGMAPLAKIYSLRVFGCVGSTNLVSAAIDRAEDPNGDGDPSDAVDVINMSLGSDYGIPSDADSVVSDAAAAAGINVVVASGNAGDVYDTGGSPGNAPRTIAVANSTDAYTQLDSVNVTIGSGAATNYGGTRGALYDWGTLPDMSGDVVRPAANRSGCDTFSSADAAAIAGKIVILDWNRAAYEADTPGENCGSISRGEHARQAGAIGVIMAYSTEDLDISINGDDGGPATPPVTPIPSILVVKSAGAAIETALDNGSAVHVNGTGVADIRQVLPEFNDEMNSSSSRNERQAGNLKPDVTAVGTSVFSAHVGTGSGGESLTGTSMATPMTAGLAALVDTAHKTWTAEQVKADIMNTADQDVYTGPNHTGTVYGPNRAGAGRIDAVPALNNSVLAYVQDDPGSVSVSFGPVAVTGTQPVLKTKTITVQNTGTTAQTYAVAYQGLTTVPGAGYTVSPSQITVGAGATEELTVTLTINPTKLTKTIDPTVDRVSGGIPREYLADASGRVVLTGTGVPSLRVPVYSAPRPASTMTQAKTLTLPNATVQTALLPLSGQQVNQGSGEEAIASTVAGFELTATSGLAPKCTSVLTSGCIAAAGERSADLKYVGVTSDARTLAANGQDPTDDGQLYFAITTQGAWTTAASREEFDIYLDVNRDGVADFVVYNTRLPGTDVLISQTVELSSGNFETVDAQGLDGRFGDTDTALFDSDSMVIPVSLAAIGVTGSTRISYAIASFSNTQAAPIDSIGLAANGEPSGALTLNPLYPGVTVTGSYGGDTSPLLFRDTPSAVLQVRRDRLMYGEDKGLGALLIHFHNVVGNKSQVVTLKSPSAPTFTFKPSIVKRGKPVTVSISVASAAGVPASGRVRLVRMTGGHAPSVPLTGTLVNGKATLKYATGGLQPGLYQYEVQYVGNTNYLPGTSARRNLRVTK